MGASALTVALLEALREALKPPDTVKNPSSTSISGHHPSPRAPTVSTRPGTPATPRASLSSSFFSSHQPVPPPQNPLPDSRQVGLCTVSVHAVLPCAPGTPVEVSSWAPRLSGHPPSMAHVPAALGLPSSGRTRGPRLCLPLQHRGTGTSYLGRTRRRAKEEGGEETPGSGDAAQRDEGRRGTTEPLTNQ